MDSQESPSQVNQVLPILKKIPLFANLDENLHREIIGKIALMYYPKNYTIFNEGDFGDALYIIKRGKVHVYHKSPEPDSEMKEIAEIHDGGFFGEIALISDAPRNATVTTLQECEIFILSKKDFKKLLETNRSLAEQISATVVARLKQD